MGRQRTVPKGPRLIDLDILLFGDAVIHAAGLEIPHPRMAEHQLKLIAREAIDVEQRQTQ